MKKHISEKQFMKPKIIASSVIRSVNRGESHGGLYVVDFEKETVEQKLDWDYPHIRWTEGGGDKGLRGLVFYGDHLYAAGATHLFKFDRDFRLVDKYTCPCFDGTHELWLYENIIYTISNQFDAILAFDPKNEEWLTGYQHKVETDHETDISFSVFNPMEDCLTRTDSLHLDSVSVHDDRLYYAGSTTKYLYHVSLLKLCAISFNMVYKTLDCDTHSCSSEDLDLQKIKLFHKDTHNAQLYGDGVIYNRSIESQTCYQDFEPHLVNQWDTPKIPQHTLQNVYSGDHARVAYTRGMVVLGSYICVGTSPAMICLYDIEQGTGTDPLMFAQISLDIRNTICGIANYPDDWS